MNIFDKASNILDGNEDLFNPLEALEQAIRETGGEHPLRAGATQAFAQGMKHEQVETILRGVHDQLSTLSRLVQRADQRLWEIDSLRAWIKWTSDILGCLMLNVNRADWPAGLAAMDED